VKESERGSRKSGCGSTKPLKEEVATGSCIAETLGKVVLLQRGK
jgi:hypothetical protein